MDRSAYERHYELDQTHFWRVARRELILSLVERFRPAPGALRVLDVGGACSLVSRELGGFGSVTVVEPDAETVAFARTQLGLDVREGALPGPLPVEGPFDVLTMLDVLEHIEDDGAALRAGLELLRCGGLLVVTVPALQWLWSAHDVALHHKRRYSKAGLRQLLDSAGVRTELLSYHTGLLLPVLAAQRSLSRLRGAHPNAKYDVKVPPAPVNAVFRGIMAAEGWLLKRTTLPIGSSLVAVCLKL